MTSPETIERPVVGRLVAMASVVVSVTLLLMTAGLVIYIAQLRIVDDAGEVINVASRQRMLSQRAGLLTHELAAVSDPVREADLRRQLEQIADDLESAHQRLLGEASTEFEAYRTREIRRILEREPHSLDASLRAYVAAIRELAAAELTPASRADERRLLDVAVGGGLLSSLDAAVGEFQAQNERRVRRLQWVGAIVALLSVGALLVTGRWVFVPAVREIRWRMDELRRSRELLSLAIEHSPLGIASCDPEGVLESANPALCAILGRPAAELVGRSLGELVDPRDAPRLALRIQHAARGDSERFTLRCRWVGGDGRRLHGVLHCGVIWSALARPQRLIALLEDRTEQAAAREEAQATRERLAHVTRLATMGEMAAGIAHEINQPLTAVANYAEACRRLIRAGQADGDLLTSTLGKVAAQARRAGEVIRRLRLFVEKRRSRSELADINEVVADALELVRTDARYRDVRIDSELAPGLPRVDVDRVQVQQVVLNLMRNGIEASQGELADRCVTVRTRAAPDSLVEVSVEDHGDGLTEELHQRLFEPFFTTKTSGLGMGLTISRSIVTSHGGSLWWTPNRDRGSVFHFTIPAAVGEDAAAAAASR